MESNSNETPRYKCNLSPETLAKAVKELNEPEDNNLRLQAIDKLKHCYLNQENGDVIPLFRSDDGFLLRFLRARKFDNDRALKMLINYHKQRDSWKEVFDNVKNPDSVKHLFDLNLVVALDGRAKDGSSVIIGTPGKDGYSNMVNFISCIFLSAEKLLESEEMQIHGMTVIEDMNYFGFDIARQMGPSLAKRFLGLMQDCLPVRLKGLNMLNEPKLFDVVFMVVSPFMKAKTKRRMKLHGSDVTSLHEIVDINLLPSCLGGTGPELDGKKWGQSIIGEGSQL